MAAKPAKPPSRPLVPPAPEPSSKSAPAGVVEARELARRYLVDAVRLNAAIAFSSQSEVGAHTRTLCSRLIVEIAGTVPPAPPEAPPPGDGEAVS
jgi:hypothetical protein